MHTVPDIVADLREQEKKGTLFSDSVEEQKEETPLQQPQESTSQPLECVQPHHVEQLFDSLPFAVFMFDPFQKELLYVNPKAKNLFENQQHGYKDLYGYLHPYDKSEIRDLIDCLLGGRCSSFHREIKIAKADGDYQWMEIAAGLTEWDKQKMVLASLFDIGELKDAEQRILSQNERLKELDELKTTFMHIMSHELRTPIASIKGYGQMLIKQSMGKLTEQQSGAVDVILRNAERLNLLIQDILDISDLQSGAMKFAPTEICIQEIVESAIKKVKREINDKKINLTLTIDDGLPKIFADGDRVSTVIYHLLRNAVTFSPNESAIDVRAYIDDDGIRFEIQDCGIGISEDQIDRIFDTFYQVDHKLERSYNGSGLGLPIAKGIVEAHGGSLWVESKLDVGSTFYFFLPEKMREREVERSKHKDMVEIETEGMYYPQLTKALL